MESIAKLIVGNLETIYKMYTCLIGFIKIICTAPINVKPKGDHLCPGLKTKCYISFLRFFVHIIYSYSFTTFRTLQLQIKKFQLANTTNTTLKIHVFLVLLVCCLRR